MVIVVSEETGDIGVAESGNSNPPQSTAGSARRIAGSQSGQPVAQRVLEAARPQAWT